MLADGTGGFVIANTNDLLGGLEKINQEQNQYYLLAYAPPESPEGSCHSIRVKVDRGGTNVRARTGYCNVKSKDVLAGKPIERQLESRINGVEGGTLPVQPMQLPYFFTSPNTARVNVAMEIPVSTLKFEKVKGKYHAEINILGIAYRNESNVAARFSDVVKLDFDEKKQMEAFQKKPFRYENQFDIGSGKYTLKIAFNASGEAFGKLESPLDIDAYDPDTFSISGIALSKEYKKVNELDASMDSMLLEGRTPRTASGLQISPAGETFQSDRSGGAVFRIVRAIAGGSDCGQPGAAGGRPACVGSQDRPGETELRRDGSDEIRAAGQHGGSGGIEAADFEANGGRVPGGSHGCEPGAEDGGEIGRFRRELGAAEISLEVSFVCFGIHAAGSSKAALLDSGELDLYLSGDGAGHIALQRDDIGQIALVLFRHNMPFVTSPNQLRRDAYPLSGLHYGAFQDRIHVEFARNRRHRFAGAALVRHNGGPRNDSQGTDPRDFADQFVRQPIGKEFLGWVTRKILEGQHRDGLNSRRGRREGTVCECNDCHGEQDAGHGEEAGAPYERDGGPAGWSLGWRRRRGAKDRGGLHRHQEPVAPMRYGLDEPGIISVVSERLPQPIDCLIDAAFEIHDRVVGPEPPLKFFPGQDLAWVLDECKQGLKGLFLKLDPYALLTEFARRQIYLEDSEADGRLSSFQRRFHPGWHDSTAFRRPGTSEVRWFITSNLMGNPLATRKQSTRH